MRMVYDVFDFMVATEQIQMGLTPDPALVPLYEKLVKEEYQEFMDATDDAHKLKEALDLIWVLIGYCIAKGWGIVGGWQQVALTNMAKVEHDPETGKVRRRADGKILKPENWKAPDMTPYVRGEQ